MPYDSLGAVLVTIAFIVPGFILSSVLAITFRRRSRTASELTFQFLALSCINHGFWSWLIVPMVSANWFARFPMRTGLLCFLIIFVSPVVLGVTATALSKAERIQRLLAVLGFNVQRFIPTAWDFKFGGETPSWVIVRLTDGSTAHGFWGNGSFAGDEPGERDLFIEAVFRPSDQGHWQPVFDTSGILIKASEIATIEFLRVDSMDGANS